jgi:hypothetical protein
MGLHEIKNLLHNKRNGFQIEEATHRMGENLASYTSDKGLITRIYRNLKILNSPQITDSIKKWATELNKTFSNKEIQMAIKPEKMLNITGQKGNANQDHTKILSHSC